MNKNKLINIIYNEVVEGTKKGRVFMSKNNLSPNDIYEIMYILSGQQDTTINSNIIEVLSQFGVKAKVEGVGWRILK